jgi:hypothetical protein
MPAEPARPERVADHRRGLAGALKSCVVRDGQQAAVCGTHAEHVEVRARDHEPAHLLDSAVNRELVAIHVERGNAAERPVVIAHQLEARIGWGAGTAGLAAAVVDEDEPVGILDRQFLHQHLVHQAEDGRVGADAERERHRGDDGVGGRPAHRSQRVARIRPQIVEPPQAARIAHLFLNQRDVAELAPRRRLRVGGRHAARAQQLDLPLEVIAQLVIHLLLHACAAQERSDAETEGCPRAHEGALRRV